MRRYHGVDCIFRTTILSICFFLSAQAQTPNAAQEHYNRGNSRYTKGDIEGAIEEFTRAIEVSARLGNHTIIDKRKKETDFVGAVSSFDEIKVIDPLTATAYSARALMRYLKKDFDGAISDANRTRSKIRSDLCQPRIGVIEAKQR